MTAPVLGRWDMAPGPARTVTILPDGCRDAILAERAGQAPSWMLSPLDAGMRRYRRPEGLRPTGVRLHPAAASPGPEALRALPPDAEAATQALSGWPLDAELGEVLALLAAPEATVAAVARAAGVSARTLQRFCAARAGQAPLFRVRLARLRRAARAMAEGRRLAAVAADEGFSDQAHLCREVWRRTGCAPLAFLGRPALVAAALAPGYAS